MLTEDSVYLLLQQLFKMASLCMNTAEKHRLRPFVRHLINNCLLYARYRTQILLLLFFLVFQLVTGLSCGVICVILCLAVLIQYRSVTDRHTTTAYTALSIASRGKYQTFKNQRWRTVKIVKCDISGTLDRFC